jgi:hypothetical protein
MWIWPFAYGRAVVQDEQRAAVAGVAQAVVEALRFPLRDPARLALGQVAAHRERRVGQVQRGPVVGWGAVVRGLGGVGGHGGGASGKARLLGRGVAMPENVACGLVRATRATAKRRLMTGRARIGCGARVSQAFRPRRTRREFGRAWSAAAWRRASGGGRSECCGTASSGHSNGAPAARPGAGGRCLAPRYSPATHKRLRCASAADNAQAA